MKRVLPPPVTLASASTNFHKETTERHLHPELYRGYSTGFRELDAMTGGLQRKSFVIVGAQSGMGKTTLMTTWALWLVRSGKRWLFCGIEEEVSEIMQRLYSGASRIPRSSFRDMGITKDEWPKLVTVDEEFHKYTSWLHYGIKSIDDIDELLKLVEPEIIIIDYVQLMGVARTNNNVSRTQEISEISRGLAQLSNGDNGHLILAAAQLNKENGWLWSEDLFRDADLAIKIEDALDETGKVIPSLRNFVVPKNRQGATGEFLTSFNGALGLFEPAETVICIPDEIVQGRLNENFYPNND